jgi:hypothetical protein
VLAGRVRAWDLINRWLWIGDTRLSLAPEILADDFISGHGVIATGYRLRYPSGGPATSGSQRCAERRMTRRAFRSRPHPPRPTLGGPRRLAKEYDDEATRQRIATRLHREWAIGKGRPRQNVVLAEKSFRPRRADVRVPLRTLLSAIQRSSELTGRFRTPSPRN